MSITDANVNNAFSDTTKWRVYVSQKIETTAGDLTVAYNTAFVRCTGGAAIALTIPQAVAGNVGRKISIKSLQTGGAVTTVVATGGSLIDGNASVQVGLYGDLVVVSNGTSWDVQTVLASQVLGNPAGSAPGVGYLGEKIVPASTIAQYILTTTETDIPDATVVLTKGSWAITAIMYFDINKGSTAAAINAIARLTDASNTVLDSGRALVSVSTTTDVEIRGCIVLTADVNISSTTTYKLRALASALPAGSGGTIQGSNEADAPLKFFARRVG
jgi:hypothetical protein